MNARALLEKIERDWGAARPDLDPEPMLTVIAVQRASAKLGRALELFFAEYDLTPPAFDVLATLRRSAPPEGLTLARLGEWMACTPPAVTKRVDALEARGLVERTPHAADRRAVLLRLTSPGRELVDRVLAPHIANEARLLSALTPGERVTLRALLDKLS